MKKIILIACLLVCSNSWGTCYYPKMSFSIPDGARAITINMVLAQSSFEAYQAEMEAYLECLDDELAKVPKHLDDYDKIRSVSDNKYNAAVDDLRTKAEKWNQTVRAYKGEPKKSSPRMTYDQCVSEAANKARIAYEYDEHIEACRLLDKANKSTSRAAKKSPTQPQKNLPKEWE